MKLCFERSRSAGSEATVPCAEIGGRSEPGSGSPARSQMFSLQSFDLRKKREENPQRRGAHLLQTPQNVGHPRGFYRLKRAPRAVLPQG